MQRAELAKIVAVQANLKKDQAEKLIFALGQTIRSALEQGEKVIYSNFGIFYTVHYPSKVITHPRLGRAKKMIMLPTNVVKWAPAEKIKEMIRTGSNLKNPTLHGRKVKQAQETAESDEVKESIEVPIRYDEVKKEIPIETAEEKKVEPVNIYEELMRDGGREEATFDGTIRLHQKRPFWRKIFNNKTVEKTEGSKITPSEAESSKVSLLGAGIFDKENRVKADPIKPPLEKTPTPEPIASDKILPQKISDQNSANWPTAKPDITYIDLSKTTVPKDVLSIIPEKIARKYMAVPVEIRGNELVVAMIDPEDIEAKELIKKYTQNKISVRIATEADISHILDQYQGLESEVAEAIEVVEHSDKEEESDKEKKALVEAASEDAPAARIVSSLLRRAIRDKASDIHIEPLENEVQVRFRLDGILRKRVNLPKDILLAVVSRIKILSNLKIDEQRLPQDGRFSIKIDNRKVDFRVSTMPTAFGEKIVMRILDKITGILTIEQLGLSGRGLEALFDNLDKSHGMILVTGPTGSGKTTTLYALIDKLFAEGVNIITLEDPIEYQIPGINQSQVNPEINYTFASGLRSIVRQDPDIIMIGEIRDGETAEMAVQSALTGHIVLSTLHTNNAAGAAPRLIDMKVEPFLLTSSLNVIIGQRLARKICEECREEEKPSSTETAKIKKIIESMPKAEKETMLEKEIKLFHGKGCKNCGNSGYKGRIGIYEVLVLTEEIKDLVISKVSASAIQDKAVELGMITMIQDGILKVIAGQTTLEEVWRVTKD